jgi:VRR-NUC domain
MNLKPEQIDHINIVNWFHYNYPELADDFHHFANERVCSIQQGLLLKRMGVKKGVPDFFLALPLERYSGLWLELKVGKNKLSPEQEEFLNRKTQRGYLCAACWGFEAAKELIITYLLNYNKNSTNTVSKILYNNNPIC